MSEAEWIAFTDPEEMLEHIAGPIERIRGPEGIKWRVIATDRQCLLWGSACCRRLGPFIDDTRWLNAIRIVEQFADGEETYPQVLAVGSEMEQWFQELGNYESLTPASMVARSCADLSSGVDSAYDSMRTPFLSPAYDASRWVIAAVRENAGEQAAERERALHCALLRDILGNPFRPLTVREEWRTATVVALAEKIYQGRAFGLLPELATALAQAGCDNEGILLHCQSDGPHIRGCWVVDLFRRVENQLRWK